MRIHSAFLFIFAVSVFCELSWKQIGPGDIEVTALERSPGMLLAGTDGRGVFYLQGDTLLPFFNFIQTDPSMDTLTVHALACDKSGYSIFAGTNLGLFVYIMSMGAPRWINIPAVPATDVYTVELYQDSILFAATDDEIYRGIDGSGYFFISGSRWDTLNVKSFLGALEIPSFRSLLLDPDSTGVLYAGSVYGHGRESFAGVLKGSGLGKSFEKYNWGWDPSAPGVVSLAASKPYFMDATFLLAGTSDGLYSITANAKSWSVYPVYRPDSSAITAVYAAYRTRSLYARVHVATETGVFRYEYPDTDKVFARMEPGLPAVRVNALIANRDVDYDSLFAGTTQGLYLYADHPGAGNERNKPSDKADFAAFPVPFNQTVNFVITSDPRLDIYDLSGRHLRTPENHSWDGRDKSGNRLPAGVYLLTLKYGSKVHSYRILLIR